jgi:hypothetical protein
MLKLYTIFFAAMAVQLLSCTPEAPAPSYIKIEEFKLSTNYINEGSSSAKVSDAWIYLNDQLIGTYELPCEIPMTASGSNKISIVAGIKNTGQAANRQEYPFYTWFDTTVTLNGGSRILLPQITYIDSLNFLWNFDFEGNSIPLTKDENSDTSMYLVKSSGDVFEGNGMGEIKVDQQHALAFLKSNLNLNIPAATKATFLEMNYACDTETEIGVITYISNFKTILPIVTLKSTDLKWNKIYIDLSNTLGTYALQGKFEIYCQIHQLSNETLTLRFDNLKIISQK